MSPVRNALLILCLLPSLVELGPFDPPEPLYSATDPGIVLLDATNIQQHIANSDKAWLVEFYSSWCGHCIHFAPTFKQLASEVKGEISKLRTAVSRKI